jgi:hypothetical protein
LGNHDFVVPVVWLRRGAVHDDCCSFPTSLPFEEFKLLGSPFVPEVPRVLGATVSSNASAFGFVEV